MVQIFEHQIRPPKVLSMKWLQLIFFWLSEPFAAKSPSSPHIRPPPPESRIVADKETPGFL